MANKLGKETGNIGTKKIKKNLNSTTTELRTQMNPKKLPFRYKEMFVSPSGSIKG